MFEQILLCTHCPWFLHFYILCCSFAIGKDSSGHSTSFFVHCRRYDSFSLACELENSLASHVAELCNLIGPTLSQHAQEYAGIELKSIVASRRVASRRVASQCVT